MKPVRVSIDVPQAREAVYDFLDVLANHETFTDHMFRDWRRSGPASGVGASGRVATGTYTLAELPGGGTRITFETAWVQVPRAEALAAPLVRAMVRRGNARALERLAEVLRADKP